MLNDNKAKPEEGNEEEKTGKEMLNDNKAKQGNTYTYLYILSIFVRV